MIAYKIVFADYCVSPNHPNEIRDVMLMSNKSIKKPHVKLIAAS